MHLTRAKLAVGTLITAGLGGLGVYFGLTLGAQSAGTPTLAAQNAGFMKNGETLSWAPVDGAPGYDLYRDGTKVSSAGPTATSAKFVVSSGTHTIASFAQVTTPVTTVTVPPTTTAPPTTTVPPPSSFVKGVLVSMDSLGNLEVGKTQGRSISYRFKANHTGIADSVRVYLIFRSGGYAAGTGGQVHAEIQGDLNGHPDGSVIGTGSTITDPEAQGPFRTFSLQASLVTGTYYNIVFTNPDPNPVANYVSIDNIYSSQGEPNIDPNNYTIVWKYDGGSTWTNNVNHSPIMSLHYADGAAQGQGYMQADISLGTIHLGSFTETITPTQAWNITNVAVRVKKTTGDTPLTITLNGVASTVPASSVSTSYSWTKVPLATTLQANQSYSLTVSGTGYDEFPMEKGTVYSLDPITIFKEGQKSTDSSRDWQIRLYIG